MVLVHELTEGGERDRGETVFGGRLYMKLDFFSSEEMSGCERRTRLRECYVSSDTTSDHCQSHMMLTKTKGLCSDVDTARLEARISDFGQCQGLWS